MKKMALLIDDEVISNVVNTMMLEQRPEFSVVHHVRSGREGIVFLEEAMRLEKALPDIIYLDINMPVMNGFKFIEELKIHPVIDYERLNIVILSSSLHPDDFNRARELGIIHFFVKPLTEYHIDQSLK